MSPTVLPEPRVERAVAGCPIARAAAAVAADAGRAAADAVAHSASPALAVATVDLLPPPADLAPVVEYVWQLRVPAAAGALWRVVVDGYLDLAVRVPLADERLQGAAARAPSRAARRAFAEAVAGAPTVVCGAARAARVLPLATPTLYTGVRFRLGAAAGLLRSPAAALMDGAHWLGDVVGARAAAHAARAVEAGVRAAASGAGAAGALPGAGDEDDDGAVVRALARAGVEAMARHLVARAAARAGGASPASGAVRGALFLLDHAPRTPGDGAADAAEEGAPRVAAVARAVAVSVRSLERRFAEQVGFAPRTYQTLRRVGAVARAIERRGALAEAIAGAPGRGGPPRRPAPADPTLSSLAHALAYTDHAHMTRSFTRVMGVAPSRYLREATAAPIACRVGPVALERWSPLGVVGTGDAADRGPARGGGSPERAAPGGAARDGAARGAAA